MGYLQIVVSSTLWNMSHNLNSLNGVGYIGDDIGDCYTGYLRGDLEFTYIGRWCEGKQSGIGLVFFDISDLI